MCKPNKSERRVVAAETIFRSFVIAKELESSEVIFQKPVNITDIHILSPSMFSPTPNGGIIPGGTDPGKIQITFQCNNVDEESASANVDLGELNYEENINTKLLCDNEIWTNRLIVQAKFSILTIVVYGTVNELKAESTQKKYPSTVTIPPLFDGPIDMTDVEYIPDSVMERIDAEVKREFDKLTGVRQNNH